MVRISKPWMMHLLSRFSLLLDLVLQAYVFMLVITMYLLTKFQLEEPHGTQNTKKCCMHKEISMFKLIN